MTAAPIMPRTGFKFMMTVKEGPDKGVAFQLLPPHVTIGRDPENNVALKDPRMSRSSAVIDFSPDVIVVRDVSTRGNLIVNGHKTAEASIRDGDIIRIGDTVLQFIVEAIALVPQPASVATISAMTLATAPRSMPGFENSSNVSPGPGFPPHGFSLPGTSYGMAATPPGMAVSSRPSRAAKNPESAKRIRFYAVVGIVLLAFAWLMNSSPAKKTKEVGLRTVEDIEKEIKGSEELQEQVLKKRAFRNDEEKTRYEEAQKHYLEGFRDYQKGQWVRAMRSFETARAIDPEHQLARRYYKLAEKQRDEMVSMLMIEGRRYREKNMYARCIAALDKVLDAIPNKDDVKYKQAEVLLNECKVMTGERFR
jgi:pSer/pThr/pTyr-binding forkhead associated (FHA) protein